MNDRFMVRPGPRGLVALAFVFWSFVAASSWACSTSGDTLLKGVVGVAKDRYYGGRPVLIVHEANSCSFPEPSLPRWKAILGLSDHPRRLERLSWTTPISPALNCLLFKLVGQTVTVKGLVMVGCSASPGMIRRVDAILVPKGTLRSLGLGPDVQTAGNASRGETPTMILGLALVVLGVHRHARSGWTVGLVILVAIPFCVAVCCLCPTCGHPAHPPTRPEAQLFEDPEVFYRAHLWLAVAKAAKTTPAQVEKRDLLEFVDRDGMTWYPGSSMHDASRCRVANVGERWESSGRGELYIEDQLFEEFRRRSGRSGTDPADSSTRSPASR